MMNPTIDYTRKRGARWYTYVTVDDVDECVRRTVELGGRVCLVADPMGAEVTLASGWGG